MCHISPAKLLRNVKRITHYNEKKGLMKICPTLAKPKLSIKILPQIDVSPHSKILSTSNTTLVSIPTVPRKLSRCNQLASECVPGLYNEDEDFISTYIDGYTHQTIFICKVCNTDHYRSTQEIKKHMREVHRICTIPSMNYPFEPRFECIS